MVPKLYRPLRRGEKVRVTENGVTHQGTVLKQRNTNVTVRYGRGKIGDWWRRDVQPLQEPNLAD